MLFKGRNSWCINKNYGGVLIIWDKLFGTFEKEKPNEEIKYGIVLGQPQTFNVISQQVQCMILMMFYCT